MTHWQRLTRLQKTLIIIAGVIVVTIFAGVLDGAWSTAWDDPRAGSGADRIGYAAGSSFAAGIFAFPRFGVPIVIVIVAVIAFAHWRRERAR